MENNTTVQRLSSFLNLMDGMSISDEDLANQKEAQFVARCLRKQKEAQRLSVQRKTKRLTLGFLNTTVVICKNKHKNPHVKKRPIWLEKKQNNTVRVLSLTRSHF